MSQDLFSSLNKPAANAGGSKPQPRAAKRAGRANAGGQSFSDVLGSAPAEKPRANEAQKTKAKQESAAGSQRSSAKKSTKAAGEKAAANPGQKTAKKSKTDKKSDSHKKRSESLKKVSTLIGKGSEATKKSPALALLTGEYKNLKADTIPEIVSKNSFIREALSEDIANFMQQPTSVFEMIDKLDLSSSVVDKALNLGLNLEEKVSPVEFLQAIGIDPQQIVAELSRIKDSLPYEGLSNIMKEAASVAQHVGAPAELQRGLKPVLQPVLTGKSGLGKKSEEIPDLLAGAQAVAPAINPAMNANAPSEASQPTQMNSISALSQVGNRGFASNNKEQNLSSVGSILADITSKESALTPASQLGAKSSIQSELLSIMQNADSASQQMKPLTSLDTPAQMPPQQNLAMQAEGVLENGLSGDANNANKGFVNAEQKFAGIDSSLSTKDIFSQFENQTAKSSEGLVKLNNPETAASQASPESFADQLYRKQFGLASSLDSSLAKTSLAQASSDPSASEQVRFASLAQAEQKQAAENFEQKLGKTGSAFASNSKVGGFGVQQGAQSQVSSAGALESSLAEGATKLASSADSLKAEAELGDSKSQLDDQNSGQSEGQSGERSGFESNKLHSALGSQIKNNFSAQVNKVDQSGLMENLPNDFSTKIIDKINMMVRGNKSAAVINMNSPEMGQLSLAIQVEDDKVNLRIMSGSDRVRSMLGAEVGKLGEAMSAHNLQLVDVESSDSEDLSQSNQRDSLEQQFDRQSTQDGRQQLSSFASKVVSGMKDIPNNIKYALPKIASSNLNSGRIQVMA